MVENIFASMFIWVYMNVNETVKGMWLQLLKPGEGI